jgi:hypothetical protein
MELTFADSELQRTLESRVRVDDHFGDGHGAIVRQRVCELLAAETLAVVASVQTFDLRADDQTTGAFSLSLTPRYRLRFEVAVAPTPRLRGSSQIDLSRIDAIRVVHLEES